MHDDSFPADGAKITPGFEDVRATNTHALMTRFVGMHEHDSDRCCVADDAHALIAIIRCIVNSCGCRPQWWWWIRDCRFARRRVPSSRV